MGHAPHRPTHHKGSRVFQDLDDTLANLLNWVPPAQPPPDLPAALRTPAPKPLRDAAKSFLTPDRNLPSKLHGQTTVDLFLHRIQENLELRETSGFVNYNENPAVSPLPLLRVDCSYLVTAWAVTNNEEQVNKEHQLLGLALQWLGRFRTIPEAVFAGPSPPTRTSFRCPTRWQRTWTRTGSPLTSGPRWGSRRAPRST